MHVQNLCRPHEQEAFRHLRERDYPFDPRAWASAPSPLGDILRGKQHSLGNWNGLEAIQTPLPIIEAKILIRTESHFKLERPIPCCRLHEPESGLPLVEVPAKVDDMVVKPPSLGIVRGGPVYRPLIRWGERYPSLNHLRSEETSPV